MIKNEADIVNLENKNNTNVVTTASKTVNVFYIIQIDYEMLNYIFKCN